MKSKYDYIVSAIQNVKIFICENLFFKHSLIFNHLNRIEKMNIHRKVSQIFIFSFLIGTFAKERELTCFGLWLSVFIIKEIKIYLK